MRSIRGPETAEAITPCGGLPSPVRGRTRASEACLAAPGRLRPTGLARRGRARAEACERGDSVPESRPQRIGLTPPPCGVTSAPRTRSEEHTSELQSQSNLVCRLLLEKKKTQGDGAAGQRVHNREREARATTDHP